MLLSPPKLNVHKPNSHQSNLGVHLHMYMLMCINVGGQTNVGLKIVPSHGHILG